MDRNEFIREGTKGGPGLRAYAYCAALYCKACATEIYVDIADETSKRLSGTDDPGFNDSETCPQPCFFPEGDMSQHCDRCGEYLYG